MALASARKIFQNISGADFFEASNFFLSSLRNEFKFKNTYLRLDRHDGYLQRCWSEFKSRPHRHFSCSEKVCEYTNWDFLANLKWVNCCYKSFDEDKTCWAIMGVNCNRLKTLNMMLKHLFKCFFHFSSELILMLAT